TREGTDARAHPEPRRGLSERSGRREGRRRARGRSGDARGGEHVRAAGRSNRGRVEIVDYADTRISLTPALSRRRSSVRSVTPSAYPTRAAISSTLAPVVFKRWTACSTRTL